MIKPITPRIFKVSASVNPLAHGIYPSDNVKVSQNRYTFFVLADDGKSAQHKVRLHFRDNNLAAVTFCDGKSQPVTYAADALTFANTANLLQDARKLENFITYMNQRPQAAKAAAAETRNKAAEQFAERYRALFAEL